MPNTLKCFNDDCQSADALIREKKQGGYKCMKCHLYGAFGYLVLLS